MAHKLFDSRVFLTAIVTLFLTGAGALAASSSTCLDATMLHDAAIVDASVVEVDIDHESLLILQASGPARIEEIDCGGSGAGRVLERADDRLVVAFERPGPRVFRVVSGTPRLVTSRRVATWSERDETLVDTARGPVEMVETTYFALDDSALLGLSYDLRRDGSTSPLASVAMLSRPTKTRVTSTRAASIRLDARIDVAAARKVDDNPEVPTDPDPLAGTDTAAFAWKVDDDDNPEVPTDPDPLADSGTAAFAWKVDDDDNPEVPTDPDPLRDETGAGQRSWSAVAAAPSDAAPRDVALWLVALVAPELAELEPERGAVRLLDLRPVD